MNYDISNAESAADYRKTHQCADGPVGAGGPNFQAPSTLAPLQPVQNNTNTSSAWIWILAIIIIIIIIAVGDWALNRKKQVVVTQPIQQVPAQVVQQVQQV